MIGFWNNLLISTWDCQCSPTHPPTHTHTIYIHNIHTHTPIIHKHTHTHIHIYPHKHTHPHNTPTQCIHPHTPTHTHTHTHTTHTHTRHDPVLGPPCATPGELLARTRQTPEFGPGTRRSTDYTFQLWCGHPAVPPEP